MGGEGFEGYKYGQGSEEGTYSWSGFSCVTSGMMKMRFATRNEVSLVSVSECPFEKNEVAILEHQNRKQVRNRNAKAN